MAIQLVTIEGNIGTGKTTIASHVAKYMPAMKFFAAPEPEDNPHYTNFLSQPKEHALAMQSWFLRERCRVYIRALRFMAEQRQSVILDFSVWSDTIFATKHCEDGFMTPAQFAEYKQLESSIHALNLPPPHLSIVLHATPDICLERSESSRTRKISKPRLEHLQRLDELYDQRWLRDLDKAFKLRFVQDKRPPLSAAEGGLPAAPSLMVLVRDWSDLTRIKASAITDAVMSTPPVPLEQWLSSSLSAANVAKAEAIIAA